MTGYRATLAAVVTAAALTALTGCSGDDSPGSVVSKAASAAQEATAEVGRRFEDVKGGIDAKGDVSVGAPAAGAGGRAEVAVTVRNTDDARKSFLVQVDFTDEGGTLRDTVAVTVSDVAAGGTKKATARSNRDLAGTLKAKVARAVRY
ncbi:MULTISPECIES: hypothetical protein [unclassified Streptomyces]|uniref:hypothetical protein n=1 Tax=unclassified Streptomyces TaxID=2593676 RepID=UPI0036EF8A12